MEIKDAIVLITSCTENNSGFGTGFVFHQDEEAVYVLTCAHVVEAVGGAEYIKVEGNPDVEVVGEDTAIDLTVLRVNKLHKPVLGLSIGSEGLPFTIMGYHLLEGENRLFRPIEGKLGRSTQINSGESSSVPTWDLVINDPYEYSLQHGYSGAPVINQDDDVVGIVRYRTADTKGIAIDIRTIREMSLSFEVVIKESRDNAPPNDPLEHDPIELSLPEINWGKIEATVQKLQKNSRIFPLMESEVQRVQNELDEANRQLTIVQRKLNTLKGDYKDGLIQIPAQYTQPRDELIEQQVMWEDKKHKAEQALSNSRLAQQYTNSLYDLAKRLKKHISDYRQTYHQLNTIKSPNDIQKQKLKAIQEAMTRLETKLQQVKELMK